MPDVLLPGSDGAPPAPDPSVPTPTDPTSQTGSVEAPPTADSGPPQPASGAEASTEESALPEAAPVGEGWKNFRSSYQNRVEELKEAKAKLTEFESKGDPLISIDAPAEEWDVAGYLDKAKTEAAPYYNRLGWEVITRHLPDVLPLLLEDPSGFAPETPALLARSAVTILQTYSGLNPQQIGEALAQYKSGTQAFGTPSYPPASTAVGMSTMATQFNLDPSSDPAHAALVAHLAKSNAQLEEMRGQVAELNKATSQEKEAKSLGLLNSTLDSTRSTMLAKVEVPPGYEHMKSEIDDTVRYRFDQDPLVRAAKTRLEGFYRQGTPDLRSAAGEMTKLNDRLAFHVSEVSKARLAPIIELEKYKTTTSTTAANTRNFPANAGTGAPLSGTTGDRVPITPQNAGDIAIQRMQQRGGFRPTGQ